MHRHSSSPEFYWNSLQNTTFLRCWGNSDEFGKSWRATENWRNRKFHKKLKKLEKVENQQKSRKSWKSWKNLKITEKSEKNWKVGKWSPDLDIGPQTWILDPRLGFWTPDLDSGAQNLQNSCKNECSGDAANRQYFLVKKWKNQKNEKNQKKLEFMEMCKNLENFKKQKE